MKSTLTKIILNSLLGAALVFLWTKFVDLDEVIMAIKGANLYLASIFFVMFVLATIFRSLRFKLLLSDIKVPGKDLIFLTFLSQLLSFLIPVRAGEVTKAIFFKLNYQVPVGKSVVWVLLDRFFDFWVVVLIITLILPVLGLNLGQNFYLWLIILGLVCSIGAVLLIKSPTKLQNLSKVFVKLLYFKKLKNIFLKISENIFDSTEILKKTNQEIFVILILTTLAIFADSLSWYFLFLSLNTNVGIVKNLVGASLSSLTFLIPAAPGYVGSAEASGLLVFGKVLGIDSITASAAAVLQHILVAVGLLIAGVVSLYILKFDLKEVWVKIFKKS